MLIAGTRFPIWLVVVYIISLCVLLLYPCIAGISFNAFANYQEAWGAQFVRVVSCNTTGLVRTLFPIDRVFGIEWGREYGHFRSRRHVEDDVHVPWKHRLGSVHRNGHDYVYD